MNPNAASEKEIVLVALLKCRRPLVKHYGFTAEELDFIINYDVKYRMGRDAETAAESE